MTAVRSRCHTRGSSTPAARVASTFTTIPRPRSALGFGLLLPRPLPPLLPRLPMVMLIRMPPTQEDAAAAAVALHRRRRLAHPTRELTPNLRLASIRRPPSSGRARRMPAPPRSNESGNENANAPHLRRTHEPTRCLARKTNHSTLMLTNKPKSRRHLQRVLVTPRSLSRSKLPA